MIFTTCVSALTACSTMRVDHRRQEAFSVAQSSGFSPIAIPSARFTVSGFSKFREHTDEPVVYIEGDGFSWIDRHTISPNPTPKNPLSLKLAALDTTPTVFYLARPCQYVDLSKEQNCTNAYWTNARFAPEIIESYDQILNTLKQRYDSKGFHLVGFSGGGAIAVLLAARRADIKSVRTIAGNLDHVALHKYKKVSPLTASLDPIAVAEKINHIPQIHFSGREDTTVPQWVAKNFARAAHAPDCVKIQIIPGVEHSKGWEDVWGDLYKVKPECARNAQ